MTTTPADVNGNDPWIVRPTKSCRLTGHEIREAVVNGDGDTEMCCMTCTIRVRYEVIAASTGCSLAGHATVVAQVSGHGNIRVCWVCSLVWRTAIRRGLGQSSAFRLVEQLRRGDWAEAVIGR